MAVTGGLLIDGFGGRPLENPWELELLQALTDIAHRAGLGIDLGVREVKAWETGIQAGVDRLHRGRPLGLQ